MSEADFAEVEFDREALRPYAFCYTGTATGNHSDIHLMFTVEDAMRWCSSPVSRGAMHGTAWSYFWTGCDRLFQVLGPQMDLAAVVDNGEWDERIESAGCQKIPLDQWPDILRPAGIWIKGDPPIRLSKPAPVNQLSFGDLEAAA